MGVRCLVYCGNCRNSGVLGRGCLDNWRVDMGCHVKIDKVTRTERNSVVDCVGELYGFTRAEILGRRRPARLAEARHCAMVILRRRHTFQAVADAFGRDHGAIMHAVKRVTDQASHDKPFAKRWAQVVSAIGRKDNHPQNRVRLGIDANIPNAAELNGAQLLMACALQAVRHAPSVLITRKP